MRAVWQPDCIQPCTPISKEGTAIVGHKRPRVCNGTCSKQSGLAHLAQCSTTKGAYQHFFHVIHATMALPKTPSGTYMHVCICIGMHSTAPLLPLKRPHARSLTCCKYHISDDIVQVGLQLLHCC